MCAWSARHLEASPERRRVLRLISLLVLAPPILQRSRAAAAGGEASAFAAGSLATALRDLDATPVESTQVALVVPEFVENGAVVPVEVTSAFSGLQNIFVFSEANPFPLVARFTIPEGTEAFVSTRIKVARSCNIVAVVETAGRFFSAVRATQVTIGGCGA
jgi:sulfur-oxidizing protein SoxY